MIPILVTLVGMVTDVNAVPPNAFQPSKYLVNIKW